MPPQWPYDWSIAIRCVSNGDTVMYSSDTLLPSYFGTEKVAQECNTLKRNLRYREVVHGRTAVS